jgi:hypothetical protein
MGMNLDTVLKWQERRAAASPVVKPLESSPHNDPTVFCARFTGATFFRGVCRYFISLGRCGSPLICAAK